MSTLRRALAVPALATALALAAGCSSSKPATSSSETTAAATTAAPDTTAAATTAAPTATTEAPATTAAATTDAPTTAPADTTAPPVSESPIENGGREIIVNVGVDDAATVGKRVEQVNKGDGVILRLLAKTPESYHLHGYDLEQDAPAGVEAQIEFTADKVGTFELESHKTNKVYLVLEVK